MVFNVHVKLTALLDIKNIQHYAKDRFCRKVSSASLSSEPPHYHYVHELSELAG